MTSAIFPKIHHSTTFPGLENAFSITTLYDRMNPVIAYGHALGGGTPIWFGWGCATGFAKVDPTLYYTVDQILQICDSIPEYPF